MVPTTSGFCSGASSAFFGNGVTMRSAARITAAKPVVTSATATFEKMGKVRIQEHQAKVLPVLTAVVFVLCAHAHPRNDMLKYSL
eukprot:312677-Prorocentrum_minimum.AAC.1